MSLGCAWAGACALLPRARFKLMRQHWKKTSLRGAYARGNAEKWYLPKGFAYASAWFHHEICLQHQRCEDEGELDAFPEGLLRVAFVCAGMWATTQKVKFSLRAAYAELTRNVAIVLGNYNQKNRTIKKTHKETIVEGQSLTLICTCHTCAYAQCLRSTFLTKTLTPPCANQGFAYARCSYDKALIKTIQNGFWGRSNDMAASWVFFINYAHRVKVHNNMFLLYTKFNALSYGYKLSFLGWSIALHGLVHFLGTTGPSLTKVVYA